MNVNKLDFNRLETLLNQDRKEIHELSQESLINLKDLYKEALDNLPQNLAPENQSQIEKETRAEYAEICNALRTNEVR